MVSLYFVGSFKISNNSFKSFKLSWFIVPGLATIFTINFSTLSNPSQVTIGRYGFKPYFIICIPLGSGLEITQYRFRRFQSIFSSEFNDIVGVF